MIRMPILAALLLASCAHRHLPPAHLPMHRSEPAVLPNIYGGPGWRHVDWTACEGCHKTNKHDAMQEFWEAQRKALEAK